MHKTIVVTLVSLLGLGAITLTAGGMPGHDHGHGPGHGSGGGSMLHDFLGAKVAHLAGEIGLTDEQKAQIHAELESQHQAIFAAIRPLVEKHLALFEAVSADEIDEQAIRAAATELGAKIGDAAVLAANLKERIHPILTEDQIETLRGLHAEHRRMIEAHLRKAAGEHK